MYTVRNDTLSPHPRVKSPVQSLDISAKPCFVRLRASSGLKASLARFSAPLAWGACTPLSVPKKILLVRLPSTLVGIRGLVFDADACWKSYVCLSLSLSLSPRHRQSRPAPE